MVQPPPRVWTSVTADELDLAAVADKVADRTCGAVVTFSGVVRDHDGGRRVDRIMYEHWDERTAPILAQTVAATLASHPAVVAAAVEHRVGELHVGDTAVVVAVASPHRAEAFAACAALMDAVKAAVPVWKHQFGDGESWFGSASDGDAAASSGDA